MTRSITIAIVEPNDHVCYAELTLKCHQTQESPEFWDDFLNNLANSQSCVLRPEEMSLEEYRSQVCD